MDLYTVGNVLLV